MRICRPILLDWSGKHVEDSEFKISSSTTCHAAKFGLLKSGSFSPTRVLLNLRARSNLWRSNLKRTKGLADSCVCENNNNNNKRATRRLFAACEFYA